MYVQFLLHLEDIENDLLGWLKLSQALAVTGEQDGGGGIVQTASIALRAEGMFPTLLRTLALS